MWRTWRREHPRRWKFRLPPGRSGSCISAERNPRSHRNASPGYERYRSRQGPAGGRLVRTQRASRTPRPRRVIISFRIVNAGQTPHYDAVSHPNFPGCRSPALGRGLRHHAKLGSRRASTCRACWMGRRPSSTSAWKPMWTRPPATRTAPTTSPPLKPKTRRPTWTAGCALGPRRIDGEGTSAR